MILLENDTVVAITKDQLINVNRCINERDYLRKTNEGLNRSLSLSDSLTTYWKRMYFKADTLYMVESSKFIQSELLLQTYEENRKKTKLRNVGICVGVGVCGVLAGMVMALLIK